LLGAYVCAGYGVWKPFAEPGYPLGIGVTNGFVPGVG
jgi:hypothetical protein